MVSEERKKELISNPAPNNLKEAKFLYSYVLRDYQFEFGDEEEGTYRSVITLVNPLNGKTEIREPRHDGTTWLGRNGWETTLLKILLDALQPSQIERPEQREKEELSSLPPGYTLTTSGHLTCKDNWRGGLGLLGNTRK